MKDIEIKVNGDDFILIDVESLSTDDEFMQYKPQTVSERKTKMFISEAINKGVKNFYKPKCDPSFVFFSNKIRFVPRKKPAVKKSYNWWEKVAKNYCYERNSRLGTILEYSAFLGVLIKKLVEEGKSKESAWNAVCNVSIELGNYYDSKEQSAWAYLYPEYHTEKFKFGLTGSREICGFFDLANTCKILASDVDNNDFWIVGGSCYTCSFMSPLSHMKQFNNRVNKLIYSVGWLVLDV